MALFARKVNNYNLFGNHAWYVPGIGGMFGLVGWYLLGALLAGLVMLILMIFVPQEAVNNYGMIVFYPLQFLPAMIYVAHKSQRNSLFEHRAPANQHSHRCHCNPFLRFHLHILLYKLYLFNYKPL